MRKQFAWIWLLLSFGLFCELSTAKETAGELLELHYLSDSDSQLDVGEQQEIERFLRYHAADTKIDLYIDVHNKIEKEEFVRRFPASYYEQKKPAVGLVYPLSMPSEIEVFRNAALRKLIDKEAVEQSAKSAFQGLTERVGGIDILKEFCTQFSSRFITLEGRIDSAEREKKQAEGGTSSWLEEGGEEEEVDDLFMELWDSYGRILLWPGIILFLLGASVGVIFYRKTKAIYYFPQREEDSRLGGSFGAGVGPVIRFRNTIYSPTQQKHQVRDSLAGL